jgi:UDP-N-acetyl-D-glucosamine dehydrogenase
MYEELYATLMDRIENASACIVVMGLGYVGLPLATEFAKAGFKVIGYDPDRKKVASIEQGVSYVEYPSSETVEYLVKAGSLQVTSDPAVLNSADVVIVCVPTPLNKSREPDLDMVMTAIRAAKAYQKPGQLVILESTTYPGTTRELIVPALINNPVDLGYTVFVAYSPERIDPGNPTYNLNNTPKVVSGATDKCLALAIRLYFSINEQVVAVTSLEVAEMTKILENSFRYVNIALVNELTLVSQKLGINFYEAIDAAKTKPYGFMPFYPGPGLGGHCIPVDPLYLTWKLRAIHSQSRFIELADEINLSMPGHVIHLTTRALNSIQKAVNGSKVLVLGVTYKPNVGDMRESPILPIIKGLQELGATVYYEDPYVQELRDLVGAQKVTDAIFDEYDTVVIATPHKEFDLKKVAVNARTIVDPRGVLRGRHNKLLLSPSIFRL